MKSPCAACPHRGFDRADHRDQPHWTGHRCLRSGRLWCRPVNADSAWAGVSSPSRVATPASGRSGGPRSHWICTTRSGALPQQLGCADAALDGQVERQSTSRSWSEMMSCVKPDGRWLPTAEGHGRRHQPRGATGRRRRPQGRPGSARALPTSRLSRPRRTAPLLLVVCGEVEAKWSGGEQVAEGPEGRALRRDVHRCRNRPGGTNM